MAHAPVPYLASVLNKARSLDLRSALPNITADTLIAADTLIVRAEHDRARAPRHVHELLTGLRHGTAVEMPGVGHSPMVEQPEVFTRTLLTYLHDGPKKVD